MIRPRRQRGLRCRAGWVDVRAVSACPSAAVYFRRLRRAGHDLSGDRRLARRGHGEGTALTGLGLALKEADRRQEPITAYEDATAIYRETRNRHGEGLALGNLGIALGKVDLRRQSRRSRKLSPAAVNSQPARRGRDAEQPRPRATGCGPNGGHNHRAPGRGRDLRETSDCHCDRRPPAAKSAKRDSGG